MGWLKLDVIFRPTVRISGPDFDDPDFNRPDFDGPDSDGPDFDGPDFDRPDFDGPDFTMAPRGYHPRKIFEKSLLILVHSDAFWR